ncbi:Protein piccolo [Bagarius yarrelli]|uniref:Protein piccolo n=1 Tax=Bagarius yarrelli TaxID=175774 RepID=A0A556THH6_BAGYA|nr:Protein piccolo [Bagarius yarrelli]
MGNEASLEGGDGALAGELTGPEAELSRLSEEERRKLISTMAEAQQARRVVFFRVGTHCRSSEHQSSGGRGSGGLSKSRTVDAFGEGPPPKPKPGRSPSSLSLLESRFRQEPKDPEQPRTGMFSSSFLSGVSSAVSSASIPKFSLFGDDEEDAAKQGPKSPGPQQGSSKGQGPPGRQGAAPQGPGGKSAGSNTGPGPQPQGPKPKDSGPQQQATAKTGLPGNLKGPQQGPAKATSQTGGTAKPGGLLCPLCKTTELNLQAKDQPPNYSTCTQCKQQVCSLCGFSPPDSEGKEWLCLNCQMQRAMGDMEPSGPSMMKQPSKQGSAPPSPQRKEAPAGLPSKDDPGKKPSMLTRQQSVTDSGKGATPPPTPKQKAPGPEAQQKPPKGPEEAQPELGQQPSTLQKAEQSTVGSAQPPPAKTAQKQDGGGFFGSFSLGGTKPPAESVTGKLFSGFGSAKGGTPTQASDSVTGKLFSGFSGLTETPKPPVATSQATDGVSGKMFGFGSSILSSATNLMTAEESKSPPGSPDSPIDIGSKSSSGSPPDSASPPDTPPVYSKEPASPTPESTDGKSPADKPISESAKTEEPHTTSNCPLCKVELNVGSVDVPNYSTCTECQKIVCNLCGFNPMPHVTENEWLCLNCQTQRALSGHLGDMPPQPSPPKIPAKPQSTHPASPARTVSSTPTPPGPTVNASPSKALVRTPSVHQAPADKSELDSVTADAKHVVESAAVKQDKQSTQVVPKPNKEQTLDTECESTTVKTTPPEQTFSAAVPSAEMILRDIANARETDSKQCQIVQEPEPKTQNKNERESEPQQQELLENDSPSNLANIIMINYDKFCSNDTMQDNKAEFKLDKLQVNKAHLNHNNKTKNLITSTINREKAHQECDHVFEQDTLSGNQAKECSPQFESLSKMQTSAKTIPDNNNDFEIKLVAGPITVIEKETHGLGTILKSSLPPENAPYSYQLVIYKDEVENEIMPNSCLAAKKPFDHLDNQNKFKVETETGNLSPSENPLAYSVRAEPENHQIEEMYFDFREEKKSPEESMLVLITQHKAYKSIQESQASAAETPDYDNLALSTPKLIESEHNKKDLPQTQAFGSTTPNTDVKCDAGNEDNKTMRKTSEKSEHQIHATPTGVEEFLANNKITITDNKKVLQHEEMEDTIRPKTANKNYDNQSSEGFVASEITVNKRQDMSSENTQTEVNSFEETGPRTEGSHNKQQKIDKTDMLDCSDIRLEMPSFLTDVEKIKRQSVKTENVCVFEKNNSLYEVGDFSESRENLVPGDIKRKSVYTALTNALKESTIEVVLSDQRTNDPQFPAFHVSDDIQLKRQIKPNGQQSVTLAQEVDSFFSEPNIENERVSGEQKIQAGSTKENTQIEHLNIFCTLDPVVEPSHPCHIACKQQKDKPCEEEQFPCTQETNQDGTNLFIKSKNIDNLRQKEESATQPVEDKEHLMKPQKKDSNSQEYSPTSPSDLAKLESTVLPILEAQTSSSDQSQSELVRTECQHPEVSTEESPELSSEEDRHQKVQEVKDALAFKGERKKLLVPEELKQDFLEDTSEGESSPSFENEKKTVDGKDIEVDNGGSPDIEILANSHKAVLPSEEHITEQKITDQENKLQEDDLKKNIKKNESSMARCLIKTSSITPEEDVECRTIISVAKIEELNKNEQPLEDNGAGIRHFKTIELNTVASVRQASDDGEPESLTDSPDDRSRGEGSSSLHASSFTPGTSPTSMSSLDEDSDSSSPSHIKSSGEGKQHRKAKHRQPGQTLPTIEDSSEEDELREEEELLKEQEKQKNSSKKSKKDKDEIRAQRRRERPKTPPSNLSPIEDASPTEEQRQEAEMEEFRRSSCSDFSPSMESEPEGFEILPEKIAAVQKVYHLPTSVSLYSPTDEKYTNAQFRETMENQPLHTSQDTYEEIILKNKSPTIENIPPGKESLYGGMLIEDYAYDSFVEEKHVEKKKDTVSLPEKTRKLRSPDEVYEDMMQIKKEMLLKEQQLKENNTIKEHTTKTTEDSVFSSIEDTSSTKQETVFTSVPGQVGKDGKPLLNAEEAYEELMRKQRAALTPGTSPTQTVSNLNDRVQEIEVTTFSKTGSFPQRRILPIPDLTVTQCSSGEEESGEEITADQNEDNKTVLVFTSTSTQAAVTEPSSFSVEPSASKLPSEPVIESILLGSEPTSQASVAESTVQLDVVDLSKSTVLTQVDTSRPQIPTVASRPSIPVTSPLPTVPQYAPTVPTIISTAPPVPPKPIVLRRCASQEKTDIPAPPPLPPPTLPKPALYSKKIPPQVPQRTVLSGISNTGPNAQIRHPIAPNNKPHVPPPVPPKPSTIPAGLSFSHRPVETNKPPIAPKPMSNVQPHSSIFQAVRPSILPTSTEDGALNLSPASEVKPGSTSPIKTPTSPRFGRLYDTYVVITLPSQPGSPIEGVTTQAPTSPGPSSPNKQSYLQFDFQSQPQPQLPLQPQTRAPLAFTKTREPIEGQDIYDPEKVILNMSHVNGTNIQVVTTEFQRTTVSVMPGKTPPPTAPRSFGIPAVPGDIKSQPVVLQNEHAYHSVGIVDLRAPKSDAEICMKGIDLSSSESQRQSFLADGRHQSAVQSSVINLSTDTSSLSVDSGSMTILTCTATIPYTNNNLSHATSSPLQLTTAKSFEPVSQIIYRPVDSQPEKPINLSTTLGKLHSVPLTTTPTIANNFASTSIPSQLETCVSGAVDLTTVKPVQTLVSVDESSSEVVTTVIPEDDGKPVDLTAGRRAVCCDVVYKLSFAGSCATQQPTAPLPEDRFGYRDDHYQFNRSPYGMRGLGGIKPSMSDTNLAEAGLFLYKSKNSYDYNGEMEGAVDLTSGKMSKAGEAVDYSSKSTGAFTGIIMPQYTQARITSAVGTLFGSSSVLRSSNGVVYSSVAAPVPSTYAITTQPGSIFCTTYNSLSGMHTSDTMPSLSNLQNQSLTRSHSLFSTVAVTEAEEQDDMPLNLELSVSKDIFSSGETKNAPTITTATSIDYTDASLEAIAASLEALSSPMITGDEKYQMERELLELEKIKQQRLAEELEWERQEIQRFREQEQLLVQKELEELQVMKQQILCQQEEERQAHLMMQKETYAQQQEQLEQIQRLQEQLRRQLEEQKYRQMYPGEIHEQTQIVGTDKKMDSGCQTDEEDNTEKAYSVGRKKKTAKKSVDSCVQTDDEDQDEWDVPSRGRRSRPQGGKNSSGSSGGVSVQALTEISVQTDSSGTLKGHSVQTDTRVDFSKSDRTSSPKRRPSPLEISQSPHLKTDTSCLQVSPVPPKSPKVLYSPISPCLSPSKSLEFASYDKTSGETSPQKLCSADPSKVVPGSPRTKVIQRSLSDPKPMSPTSEERAANFQFSESYSGKGSPSSTPTGTQKKVKRTLPNPPSEEEAANAGQTAYSTASARRRLCRSSNMARAKILQDIDRELDLVERESSKLRKKQAELDEEEKEIDAKLRYLEMGINRRKDALLKEREKRERAYLQSVAEDRDYMSDSEVSNIRETRRGDDREEVGGLGLERPHTAPQSELDEFATPQTKYEYGKYSQYHYPQYQQSLYQAQQPFQSQSIYSSVPSLTTSQQQSYHQMLLLQQKARQQAALLSELDATKVSTNYENSSYLGGKYGSHLDLHGLEDRGGSIAGSPMSNVSVDSFYTDLDHQTSRSYLLLEEPTELSKSTAGLSSTSYGIAERELAKAECLLRRTAADVGTDYLGSSSRLHSYGKTQDDEDPMEEPYELKLLKQQLKQEFRRSTGGTENIEQLASLSHHYTPSTGVTSGGYRAFPKTEKYSISRLTLEKQAAKQLPTSMLYQKHKSTSSIGKYSLQDNRGLDTDYSSYLGSSGASTRSSRLLQDEITFGLHKNIAEQQKYMGSHLGVNLAGSLNLGSLNLSSGIRSSMGEDSAYPSGSRSRPSSRPSSMYGLDLSIKRDISSSSLRLKSEGDPSSETAAYQVPSARTKPTSLAIGQGGRGRIPIVAQNSEEESPLSPVGQPMGMARASAGPLPPISADSRDQFGSCLSLQDPQQQHLRDDPTRGRSYMLIDDLQGTMSDSEAYHLRREETDWFDKPREDGQGLDRRQIKSQQYPFPHARIKLQRDPKDRSVSGNGLGIRIIGGKEVPGSDGEIGAYVAKVLPGGTAEQSGKIVEGMQVLEWNGIYLSSKTYEEVQVLVNQHCSEAELCVRLDLNMLSDSEGSHLDIHEQTKTERPPRSPGVDPKQLAAELQKVSQQQAPSSTASSLTALDKSSASGASSSVPSPGQPASPSTSEATKTPSHPITGEIQLQINYDKQLGNLIVHVLQARNLAPRDNNGYSDPFVKVYLLPGRGAENKRRSKHAQKSLNPEWNQTVIYKNIHLEQLKKKTLEVSVWDYDKCSSNDFLGEVLIDLSNTVQLDNMPHWLPLKEQCEGEHHRRSHSGQGRQHSSKAASGHSPKTSGHSSQDSPKSSVIKSRSHGIFPDPAKDTTVPTIEKSHSSPSTSKPSPSEGQARSHGTPRAHGKSGASRAHPNNTMATVEAATEQHRLQPIQTGCLSVRQHRHSVAGVLTIQTAPSNTPGNEISDGHHLTLRKAMSEERPQRNRVSRSHRSADAPVTAASLDSGLSGSAFSLLEEEEEETNGVDSAIFQVPRFGKVPNGTDVIKSVHGETEGKTQVMGEIKIALKKEMKTEGEHLVLEILQCRNITYKFKTPDHLPDMYVKLYVVNIATQKRIIKKKTRVCRHDREPSFNETFRFCMNPTGHSIQLFLVSNGGKFVKKTLIGEAYVWLDKVDLRKRVVSWHKLLATTAQIQS